ncbi:MAG: hypothetical protein ACR2GH_06875 [Pseudonocardia sp.]
MAGRRTASSKPKRTRGTIDELPSGALRVRVYAGTDPVTKRVTTPVAVIPAGPKAEAEAKQAEFLRQLDERRNPRTSATLDQFDGAPRHARCPARARCTGATSATTSPRCSDI